MKIKDYRNTEFCKKMTKISRKKNNLKKIIKKEHPRTQIYYNIISKFYREKFNFIYNDKCVYCGASKKTLGVDRLEIDHFIHESSFNSKKEAGEIENLVTACYACNRRKGSFRIINSRKFNPDLRAFKKLFYRSSDYSIKISYRYLKDSEVQEFYNILKLGADFRKLDFLMLRLLNLREKLKKLGNREEELQKINESFMELMEKRNNINPLS